MRPYISSLLTARAVVSMIGDTALSTAMGIAENTRVVELLRSVTTYSPDFTMQSVPPDCEVGAYFSELSYTEYSVSVVPGAILVQSSEVSFFFAYVLRERILTWVL